MLMRTLGHVRFYHLACTLNAHGNLFIKINIIVNRWRAHQWIRFEPHVIYVNILLQHVSRTRTPIAWPAINYDCAVPSNLFALRLCCRANNTNYAYWFGFAKIIGTAAKRMRPGQLEKHINYPPHDDKCTFVNHIMCANFVRPPKPPLFAV